MHNDLLEVASPTISDTNIEELFLGNILRSPERLRNILSDVTLTSEAFSLPRTRAVFDQMIRLYEEGILPETDQVQSRLNGECPDDYAHRLLNASYAIDLVAFAERLMELGQWRKRRQSALALLDAVTKQDLEKYSRAKSIADDDTVDIRSYYSPERLANEFRQYMGEEGVESFTLPFDRLTDCLAGGFRRKQFTVLGGWTSHGKSVLIDQILTFIARNGHKVHLYMNEMGHEERVARLVCSDSGIPMRKLLGGGLTDIQKDIVEESLSNLPFSITPCAGWSVEELTFDVRAKDYDVIGIDILHQFDYDSESELARISRLLTRVAKQANCHVLATVHLNEFRANDIIKPRPVSRDIRGTGMLQRDPDNIMFIHREQDPFSGDPLTPATIYFSKVRNGELGHSDVFLNPTYMRFETS